MLLSNFPFWKVTEQPSSYRAHHHTDLESVHSILQSVRFHCHACRPEEIQVYTDGQSPVSSVQSPDFPGCRHCPPCPLQEVMCRCGRTAVMPRPAGGGAALQCCSWCARRLQCQAAARAGTRASHAAAPPPGLGPRTVRGGEI